MSLRLAGEVDRDHRRRSVTAAHLVEVVGGQVLLPDDPDGCGGADVADGETAGDLVPSPRRARRLTPVTTPSVTDSFVTSLSSHSWPPSRWKASASDFQMPMVPLGMEAERLEGALAGEVGEEHASRQILGADGEHRRAHVAEDAVHAFVLGVLGHPIRRGHLVLGETGVIARRADALDQLGALARELAQQEAPAAAGDVDVLTADAVQNRRAAARGCRTARRPPRRSAG